MNPERPSQAPSTSPFENMRELTAKLISVPKEEVARREREWKEARKEAQPTAPVVDQH